MVVPVWGRLAWGSVVCGRLSLFSLRACPFTWLGEQVAAAPPRVSSARGVLFFGLVHFAVVATALSLYVVPPPPPPLHFSRSTRNCGGCGQEGPA